jgi:hypothetical protein
VKPQPIPTIAQIMKETCEFVRYTDHTLWYAIYYFVPAASVIPDLKHTTGYAVLSEVFEFPIPLDEDAMGIELQRDMKAINLMRWIRKHIEFLTEARKGGA